jgi:ATP-dependent RNA helicase DDX46/PRP5
VFCIESWSSSRQDGPALSSGILLGDGVNSAVFTCRSLTKTGQVVPEGEQKLHLLIEGPTPQVVKLAKAEIKRILEESTERAFQREAPTTGRYNVL